MRLIALASVTIRTTIKTQLPADRPTGLCLLERVAQPFPRAQCPACGFPGALSRVPRRPLQDSPALRRRGADASLGLLSPPCSPTTGLHRGARCRAPPPLPPTGSRRVAGRLPASLSARSPPTGRRRVARFAIPSVLPDDGAPSRCSVSCPSPPAADGEPARCWAFARLLLCSPPTRRRHVAWFLSSRCCPPTGSRCVADFAAFSFPAADGAPLRCSFRCLLPPRRRRGAIAELGVCIPFPQLPADEAPSRCEVVCLLFPRRGRAAIT